MSSFQAQPKATPRSLLVFLIPLFFLPWTINVLDFNKQALLVVLVFVTLFFWILKVLVSGKLEDCLVSITATTLILIAFNKSTSMNTKTVWGIYNSLIEKFQNEFNILLDVTKEDLLKHDVDTKLIEIILLNRKNKLTIKPGYDGVYGQISLPEKQKTLF